MARIGLALGGAIIGSFFGPLGAQIGFTLGGVLGGMLFPAKLPSGPRLNDLIVSTGTDGAPIPFGYGSQRVSGNVIWAPPIVETSKTKSVKGGPKQTTYSYTASFAVAFGEGQAAPGRIWFDSKVVFDAKATLQSNGQYQFTAPITSSSVVATSVLVQSTLNPPVGTEVIIKGASQGNGTFQVTASTPTQFGYFNPAGVAPGSSGTAAMPPIKYPAPAIYIGSETQNADPTIQAAVGAANCPAFRGLCYAVWTNFPLADFGNRIPNVRGEVSFEIFTTKTGNLSTFDAAGGAVIVDPGNTPPGGITTVTGTSVAGDCAIVVAIGKQNAVAKIGLAPDGTWSLAGGATGIYTKVISSVGPLSIGQSFGAGAGPDIFPAAQAAILLSTSGQLPVFTIRGSGSGGTTLTPPAFTPTAGSSLIFISYGAGFNPSPTPPYPFPYSIGDTVGNNWQQVSSRFALGNSGNQAQVIIAYAQKVPAQSTAVTVTIGAGGSGGTWFVLEVTNIVDLIVPTTTPSISDIVTDVCKRCGLAGSDIDTSALAIGGGSPAVPVATPIGYVVGRPTTGQAALKPLTTAFFFDAVESGGVLKFVPRGGSPAVITIPESDLGLLKDKAKLTEQLGMAQELPRDVQVLFLDKALDYQQNKSQKRRKTRIVRTKNQTIIELPMTIDSTTARQIAEKWAFLAALERHPYDTNLWKSLYMLFDPTDVIQFAYEGLVFQARIVKGAIGLDYTSALSLVSEDANNYLSSVVGSSGTGVTPAQANVVPDTILFLFDIPLLRDSDSNASGSGIYFAMSSLDPAHWPGGSLQKSSDNANFTEENQSTTAVHFGTATSVLPAPPNRGYGGSSPWTWDTVSRLTVFMQNGTLAGATDFAVYNGANALLVGNEVIQFANAVQNLDGSYTLSRLLRGRRGTEGSCATHGVNEMVVDLNAAGFVRQAESTSNLQVLRYYEAVTFGNTVSPATSQQFVEIGQDLMPYAVTSVKGSRDGSNNLTVTWIRRTRIGGDWLNGVSVVPLSETVESYDVDILSSGGAVVRTFSGLTSPSVLYSSAQQTADFGGPLASVSMAIYQNSAAIGRGFKKSVTL